MEDKISKELAEEEFVKWCELNDLDCDEALMNDEDKAAFEPLKARIVKAIQKGSAVIDGDTLEYTLSDKYEGGMAGMKITVNPPTARMFAGMDGYKETQQIKKIQGAMSALCGVDVGVFAKMKVPDWKFFNAVCILFMSA